MAVYRITKFTSGDMSKAAVASESLRGLIESTNAEAIDIVDMGGGNGLVVARYADEASMNAATETAQNAFGQLVASGDINGDSIEPASGSVVNSFCR